MVTGMLQDTRAIESVWLSVENGLSWTVGQFGVEKIEAYGEPSQRAYVPWLAIWIGGEISLRVNAAKAECVVYGKEVGNESQ